MEPTPPKGFDGFIFPAQLGAATVPVLVHVDDGDDGQYPPDPPQAVSLWINDQWVDLDEIGSAWLSRRLDKEAFQAWDRMIDDGRLDAIFCEDSDV